VTPSRITVVASVTFWPLSVTPLTDTLAGVASRHSTSRSGAGAGGGAVRVSKRAAPVYFVPGSTSHGCTRTLYVCAVGLRIRTDSVLLPEFSLGIRVPFAVKT
jgi:hypothetical protein